MEASGRKQKLTTVIYIISLLVSLLILYFINKSGMSLEDSKVVTMLTPEVTPHSSDSLLHILLALTAIIFVSKVVGFAITYIGQPAVMGEVLGGILLGPSLFANLAPETHAYLFPQAVMPFLGIVAQIGVVLYMFVVGLELDLKELKKDTHATVAISHASILFPFLLGTGLALLCYENYAPSTVSFTVFSLFLGISLSITAFPVLARILKDKKINNSKLGAVALTCAAIDDVTAWCLLAIIVSFARSQLMNGILTVSLTILYIGFMLVVVAPLLRKNLPRFTARAVSESITSVFFIGLLLSAVITELIGIHAIFGAFLFGAIIPKESLVSSQLSRNIENLVKIMFLPAFFAFTGMRTEFGLLTTVGDWLLCGAIILLATLGKFGGTWVAARFSGMSSVDSAALGILMNTRGLVELIVLNIGLDLKILSPTLFTMLVLMALVTTFATSPIFQWITRKQPWSNPEL